MTAQMDAGGLLERAAIHDVIVRYCRAVDRGDEALALSCYHPDAIDDHGSFFGSSLEFVRSVCGPSFERYSSLMHYIMNEIIDFDGPDAAASEAYFIAYMRLGQQGDGVLQMLGGRYVDRFERRSGEWRIARRVVVYEWADTRTPGEGFPPSIDSFEQGHRFDSDIAYTQRSTRPERQSLPSAPR